MEEKGDKLDWRQGHKVAEKKNGQNEEKEGIKLLGEMGLKCEEEKGDPMWGGKGKVWRRKGGKSSGVKGHLMGRERGG